MIIKIILIFVWILASVIEGLRDGFFYHFRNVSSAINKKNTHWIFVIERGIILSLIVWIHRMSNSFINTSVFTLALIMIFSFIHNGIYYKMRNYLDKSIYPKGFWSSSVTSEATMEFNLVARVFLFITGLIGIYSTLI